MKLSRPQAWHGGGGDLEAMNIRNVPELGARVIRLNVSVKVRKLHPVRTHQSSGLHAHPLKTLGALELIDLVLGVDPALLGWAELWH